MRKKGKNTIVNLVPCTKKEAQTLRRFGISVLGRLDKNMKVVELFTTMNVASPLVATPKKRKAVKANKLVPAQKQEHSK